MTNYKVTLPHIDDTCKGGNCKHKHIHELSNEPEQPKVEVITQPQTQFAPRTAGDTPGPPFESHNHTPEPKSLTHAEMEELIPRGLNFAKCKGEDCGKPLKNKKFTKNFKKCTNCNSNSVPLNNEYCPTCGMNEPSDESEKEDFWDESEIDSETLDAMLDKMNDE